MSSLDVRIFIYQGDVQWNKNRVFNLCLTIAYFWTTLFVMIILYIFIYGRNEE
jgi:1-acyl-sn-glycerol-3-phosphate acyltransferase